MSAREAFRAFAYRLGPPVRVLSAAFSRGFKEGLSGRKSSRGSFGRASRHIPRDVLGEVFRRCNGRCVECGATEFLEVDHIIPWSLGGATSVDNLQLLCRDCKRRKSNNI